MTNVWVIRANNGKYTGHFVDGAYVGAGWLLEHDLSKVETREELTAMYRQAHPEQSSQVVGVYVGTIWLFLKMAAGDYVITPLFRLPMAVLRQGGRCAVLLRPESS